MKRPIQMSHDFLEEILHADAVTVDATMGNGHDTLFLAQHSKKVYAFDIQEKALEATQKRLTQANITNAHLHLVGHEQLSEYVLEPVSAAIFNLGYLPNADKTCITKAQTTIAAIQALEVLLVPGGRIAIMVYDGHDGGDDEKEALEAYLETLDQQMFTVTRYQTMNQINHPPYLLMVEKHKRS